MSSSQQLTIYLGYGSNLWKAQMLKRCPHSTYMGIARLNGYRWIINSRGYANVVEVPTTLNFSGPKSSDDQEVWGLVYSLTSSDEEKLDINEGVPFAYTKEQLSIDFWPAADGKKPRVDKSPEQTEMLAYIDWVRTEPDEPKKEYVYRMNMGIADAVEEGMPERYVRDVMRAFIPADSARSHGAHDPAVARLAEKQAAEFEDEN